MLYVSDETIERFIKEDVPYIDLTTIVLGIGQEPGQMRFTSRESAVIAGVEEVIRIFDKLDVHPTRHIQSGARVDKGEVFLEAEGSAASLHAAWKVSANILEYCSGIATRTRALVDRANRVSPGIAIVTTRKGFPGTKELAIKSVIAGGGYPHRLGLSETILIFRQHLNFLGGLDGLQREIQRIKARACEKKVIVEVESFEDALRLAESGVDGLQFDKGEATAMRFVVEKIRAVAPEIVLIAAGGINESNVEDYAATGVNAIATTSVYYGKPVDIGVIIEKRA